MREELGIGESGLHRVVNGAFGLLHLIAFFTAGEDKPAQTWHLRKGLTRLARGGPDPLRHPEGLRPRRGDRLGRARRGRRLRRRARQGHAAARGPRLPDDRRRRDHGQVHAMSDYTVMRAADGARLHGRRCRERRSSATGARWAPSRSRFNVRVLAPGTPARPAGRRPGRRPQPRDDRGDLLRARGRDHGQARRRRAHPRPARRGPDPARDPARGAQRRRRRRGVRDGRRSRSTTRSARVRTSTTASGPRADGSPVRSPTADPRGGSVGP